MRGQPKKEEGDADAHKQQVKKRESKALKKSLQLAQLSTASMGKFDQKVNKHEPDALKSVKKPKDRGVAKEIATLSKDAGHEKQRNMKVLQML